MSRKKGIAVLIPALALVAAATEAHAGTMAVHTLTVAAAAEPTPGPDDPQNPDQGQAPTDQPSPADPANPTDPANPADPANPTDPANTGNPTAPPDPNDPNGQGGQNGQDQNDDQSQNRNNQAVQQGPKADDFIDIRRVQPNLRAAAQGRNASRGSFNSRCGRNQNGHHNPDNFIVAPGVSNGAHHIHDYVGNLSTDGFSTDQSLAAAGTTCAAGDKSTYFWPVLRIRNQQDNSDQAQQSTKDLNVGRVVTPASATMRFKGNPRKKVTAMPKFLRVITGDAKAATNGPANARAQWTCSGLTNRVTTKYPLCPRNSRVTRVLNFPSCWDGRNVDSANHRTHVVFPDQAGNCPAGTRPVPQLQMTLTYNVPAKALAFAVDSFPEQLHNPVTDHADFENVMPNRLMRQAVGCINSGRNC